MSDQKKCDIGARHQPECVMGVKADPRRETGTGTMGRDEALAEARRRWGAYGSIRPNGDEGPGFKVGRVPFGSFTLSVYGCGDSWEEAFADADRRVPASPRETCPTCRGYNDPGKLPCPDCHGCGLNDCRCAPVASGTPKHPTMWCAYCGAVRVDGILPHKAECRSPERPYHLPSVSPAPAAPGVDGLDFEKALKDVDADPFRAHAGWIQRLLHRLDDQHRALIDAARQEERERCAKELEAEAQQFVAPYPEWAETVSTEQNTLRWAASRLRGAR